MVVHDMCVFFVHTMTEESVWCTGALDEKPPRSHDRIPHPEHWTRVASVAHTNLRSEIQNFSELLRTALRKNGTTERGEVSDVPDACPLAQKKPAPELISRSLKENDQKCGMSDEKDLG